MTVLLCDIVFTVCLSRLQTDFNSRHRKVLGTTGTTLVNVCRCLSWRKFTFSLSCREIEKKNWRHSHICVLNMKLEFGIWLWARKQKKKASQNIRLCNVQVSLLLYKHDMTGEIHLGIPINDLMWAVALNITWIYLFSVSVFLSLSFLYCPLRICWLWWVNPLISVSPSSSSSSSEKKNLFVLIPTARRQLSCPTCLLYIPPKCCCTVCQFCTVHPCRLSSSNISFSSVDVLSLETPL